MGSEQGSFISSLQPELEEFLSALDGFLSKQAAPKDPSHLRFLEIFFRIVKSDKGHLLRVTELGTLRSVMSYGIGPEFDQDFNVAHEASFQEPCPLDVAFRDRDAVAIVDINRESDIPPWFSAVMKKYGFVSLVAVPLLGGDKPIGILCAYYHDVCLFDRGTLGHLMMIGKMVGQATEKSRVADRAQTHGEKERSVDQFLKLVLNRSFAPVQIYTMLAKILSESMSVSGLLCGPVTRTEQGLAMTVAAAAGVPSSTVSQTFLLPPFASIKISSGSEMRITTPCARKEWTSLQDLIAAPSAVDLCHPLTWRESPDGVVLSWRNGDDPFDEDEQQLQSRLAGVASLAMHVRD